jgi:hypothetical protein
MKITCTEKGVAVEITGAETLVLLEELGDVSSRSRKVRQLHRELGQALEMFSAVERAQERSGIVEISGRRRPGRPRAPESEIR